MLDELRTLFIGQTIVICCDPACSVADADHNILQHVGRSIAFSAWLNCASRSMVLGTARD